MKNFALYSTGVLLLSIMGNVTECHSQSLPTIQTISMRAPASTKTDGMPNEWNGQMQAYNKVTEIYYTIANDDNKLYLTIQSKDPTIITKIVVGGVTFTLNQSAKKNDKNGISITFPTYDARNRPLFLILNNKPEPTKNAIKNKMQADSFIYTRNQQLVDKLKIIGVTGIAGINDNFISVYNDQGIKAAALFDNDLHFTYELALPLKLLSLDLTTLRSFAYNIKLNGEIPKGSTIQYLRPDKISYLGTNGVSYLIGSTTPENMTLAYPTDFSGQYILAK